jgi:2-C-methyl-D-erythritol 2,4-cyclodiphosphate synthase
MLGEVVEAVAARGLAPVNCDLVIQLERPALNVHIDPMRKNLAAVLGVAEDRVGVKATTAEGIGEVGAGSAVAVDCVCLLSARG